MAQQELCSKNVWKVVILSQLQSFRAEYLHLSRAWYNINQSIVTEFASLVSQFKRLPL